MIYLLTSYGGKMSERSRTATVLVVVLVALLSLSAIAIPVSADRNTTLEQEITVTEDGNIETIDVTVAADEETYDEWDRGARFQGYDSYVEYFANSLVEDHPGLNDYTTEERDLDDGREAHVQFTDVNVSGLDDVSVTVDDGTVRWEETHSGELDDDVDESTLTAIMPGEITDSNANEVSDGVAIWEFHEEYPEEIYAEATVGDEGDDIQSDEGDEIQSNESDDDQSDEDDNGQSDESEDGLPGLGVGAALAALIGTVVLALRAD